MTKHDQAVMLALQVTEATTHDCQGPACFCKGSPECEIRDYGHLWTNDGRCSTCGIVEP